MYVNLCLHCVKGCGASIHELQYGATSVQGSRRRDSCELAFKLSALLLCSFPTTHTFSLLRRGPERGILTICITWVGILCYPSELVSALSHCLEAYSDVGDDLTFSRSFKNLCSLMVCVGPSQVTFVACWSVSFCSCSVLPLHVVLAAALMIYT